ncbi:MAG: hypothetical protein LJE59_08670 [Chromatiaceae bacterium]|nr:hypothetical protein [Chromatiaceae bacterium]
MPQGSDFGARTERRGNKPPIPPNITFLLTQEQKLALRKVEDFGWQLAFVRHGLFEQPVAVVVSPDRQRLALLETDGQLNMNPAIALRG